MISRSDLAAIFRRLADEIEKVDNPEPEVSTEPPPPTPEYVQTSPPLGDKPLPVAPAPPPPPMPAASVPPALAKSTDPQGPKPVIDLDTIKGIQQAFNSIRAPNYAKLEENGIHDAVMTWALKEFQATAAIPVTGEIDKITVDTLHKIIFGAPKP
jgi:Putative peptidoglycan binding domain